MDNNCCPYCGQTRTRKNVNGYCVVYGCEDRAKQEKINQRKHLEETIIKQNKK
jgi:RNA polymerase subunit RPABC4/transcription elongation factor Spt4